MFFPRLKDLREDMDFKQENIASLLGINLSIQDTKEDFYHTSTDYLLGRTNVRKPYPKK